MGGGEGDVGLRPYRGFNFPRMGKRGIVGFFFIAPLTISRTTGTSVSKQYFFLAWSDFPTFHTDETYFQKKMEAEGGCNRRNPFLYFFLPFGRLVCETQVSRNLNKLPLCRPLRGGETRGGRNSEFRRSHRRKTPPDFEYEMSLRKEGKGERHLRRRRRKQ